MLRQSLAAAIMVMAGGIAAADSQKLARTAPTPAPADATQPRGSGLVFTLGAGAAVKPAYFGSDEYRIGPSGSFGLHYLGAGRFSFGDPDPTALRTGWGLRGSSRYVGARDASEFDALAGLDDIDAAVELGLGVGYTARSFGAYLDARRGFGGHEGWVAEAGLDVIARPTAGLTVTAGPRLLWGDDAYSATYFGVTPAEASAALPIFDAQGGLTSAGVALGMTYRLNDDWGLEGALTYDRLMNDAADSPIVQPGSRDQWGVRFGLTRVIRLGG